LALYYLDASALVKLVQDEPESNALRTFVGDADLVSCELVLTEVPRAIRRASSANPALPAEALLERAGDVVDALGLLPLDRGVLETAGALAEPALRALDAIHITAARADPTSSSFASVPRTRTERRACSSKRFVRARSI